MERGWIKLWRKSLDNEIFTNLKLWHFWTWCLLKASHKDHAAMINFQTEELTPGQFIFGRKKASQEINLSERSIRTCLAHLERKNMLAVNSTNKYSIITIINWLRYQGKEESNRPTKRPTKDQQTTTDKNDYNGKKEDTCADEVVEILLERIHSGKTKSYGDILQVNQEGLPEDPIRTRALYECPPPNDERELRFWPAKWVRTYVRIENEFKNGKSRQDNEH